MLSYARVDGRLSRAQAAHMGSLGIDVQRDPRGATILLKDIESLEQRLEKAPSMSSVNNRLNEVHQKFSAHVGGILGEESISAGRVYLDVLLADNERMAVTGGKVHGFALVGNHDGTFEVMNEGTLASKRPYISGYGSLLNPTELTFTYGAHVDFADDNMFWIEAKGYQVIMNKVPTRDFWEKDPLVISQSGVLNIMPNPEGVFVAIVYDANSDKREPHKTFMREQDYRFYEIPPEAIDRVISDRKEPYDKSRPIFGVMASKIKLGEGGAFDIQAANDANPILRYNATIIRGLSLAAFAERATPGVGVGVGHLLMTYANNTLMPDGITLLSSRPEFKKALGTEKIRAESELVAIVRAESMYTTEQR